MASRPVRSGLNAGTTFAVVMVFLALIGFTVTGAALVAKLFGMAPVGVQMPGIGFLVIFLALLALWCGALAARDSHDASQAHALTAGLVAGLLVGVVSTLLGLIFAGLLAKGTDPRPYLAMVSPESMRLYLFNLGTVGALIHLFLWAGFSALGGFLAYEMRKAQVGKKVSTGTSGFFSRIAHQPQVENFRKQPYAIYIVYGLAALLMIFLPRVWGSYMNYIVGTVGIYVIMGLGLNIITGLAGQLVLGYVAFFAIGAYTVALLTATVPHNLHWNFWIVLVLGILTAALTGILLGLPILRLRGDYLAIVTLGFGEIIRIMLRSDVLTPLTAGPKGVRDIAGPTLFGAKISSDINFLYLILLAVLLIIFVTNRLQNSRPGRAWVAIREDEIAARATGINTFQSKLLALAIGAAFAGLGGVLFASRNQFTGPEDHSLMVSINVLALVIVGGMGSIPGIILGAFALKGLPEILRELESYRLMVFSALLVVMMIIRPEGLWPSTRPRLERAIEKKEPEKQVAVPGDSGAANSPSGESAPADTHAGGPAEGKGA